MWILMSGFGCLETRSNLYLRAYALIRCYSLSNSTENTVSGYINSFFFLSLNNLWNQPILWPELWILKNRICSSVIRIHCNMWQRTTTTTTKEKSRCWQNKVHASVGVCESKAAICVTNNKHKLTLRIALKRGEIFVLANRFQMKIYRRFDSKWASKRAPALLVQQRATTHRKFKYLGPKSENEIFDGVWFIRKHMVHANYISS